VSLVVIGLNHRTTPVELLERMAVPSSELPKALHTLERSENLAEVAVLSTCNRTEVYARCTRFHPAVEDVRNFLTDQSSLDPDTISDAEIEQWFAYLLSGFHRSFKPGRQRKPEHDG
jgi:glutamyl-tRNA reductase